jgi:predicted tellurium resistance membrane protein TerC
MGCATFLLFAIVFFVGIGLALMGVQNPHAYSAAFIILVIIFVLYLLADMGTFNKRDK